MRKKKEIDGTEELAEEGAEVSEVVAETSSELANLVDLWEKLKALGVNSIGDLEVRIARLK